MRLIIVGSFVFLCGACVAQKNGLPAIPKDTAQWQMMELRDGSRLIGKMIDRDEVAVLFRTRDLGEVRIATERIAVIRKLPSDYSLNGFPFENPNTQTYFASASAIPLAKGEVRYTNVALLANAFSVGLTKHLTVGVGAEFFSLIERHRINAGAGAKLGFPVGKRIHLAISGVYQQVVYSGNRDHRVYGYANKAGFSAAQFTYSGKDWNVTAAAGYLFTSYFYERGNWYALSGMARATTHVAFVMENVFRAKNNIFNTAFGVRYLIRNASLDFGAVVSTEYGLGDIPTPFVGCSVRL